MLIWRLKHLSITFILMRLLTCRWQNVYNEHCLVTSAQWCANMYKVILYGNVFSISYLMWTRGHDTWQDMHPYTYGRGTPRVKSKTHLYDNISDLHDPVSCHHHLEAPQGTTYWNTIVSLLGNTFYNPRFISLMLSEADTYTTSFPLEIHLFPRGCCSLPRKGGLPFSLRK